MPHSDSTPLPFRRAPGRCVALCVALLGSLVVTGNLRTQTIEITSVPAYATNGSLVGRVGGVDFATHRVAVYIQIEGLGWWSKPSFTNPSVPIGADGTFTANVTSGGLDPFATWLCAALLPPGANPPIANGSARIPASLHSLALACTERYGRTVQFAGRTWAVKDAPLPVGPGGNLFSSDPTDVWVDGEGRLHLAVKPRLGQWWCTEVALLESLGHGTYWFTTESEVEDLDPFVTFGAFTWDAHGDDSDVPRGPHREIDFEDSRWGNTADPQTSQSVVQPWDVPGNLERYTVPDLAGAPTLTRVLTWTPAQIVFVAARGRHTPCNLPAASILQRRTYQHDPAQGHYVPSAGRERFRFNLWLNGNGAPADGQPAEVVIGDFRFSSNAGVFEGGCGVNPQGSIRVLSGAPVIGTTLVLGLDNPLGTQNPGALPLLLVSLFADTGFPCGTPVPGWGMAGAAGELQVSLVAMPFVLGPGSPWAGPGSPAPVALPLPALAALLGVPVYAQGVLVDPSFGAQLAVALTDALELCPRL